MPVSPTDFDRIYGFYQSVKTPREQLDYLYIIIVSYMMMHVKRTGFESLHQMIDTYKLEEGTALRDSLMQSYSS